MLVSCALAAHGAERASVKTNKSPAPDLDFLEYLGTLENDEDNWTDIAKMELPQATTVAGKNAATATPKDKPKAETASKSAGSEK